MRKKTIAIFFIIGVIVAIIGGIIYGVGIAGAVSSAAVNADGTVSNVSAGLVGTALIGVALLIIGGIINAVGWIGALVATGRQGRWGWFILVFLLNGLGELIYLIAGPAIG
jgi:hypothetical protein